MDVGAACEAHLLGRSVFWILDHLRSFLVQSWGEKARVGQHAAKIAIMLITSCAWCHYVCVYVSVAFGGLFHIPSQGSSGNFAKFF